MEYLKKPIEAATGVYDFIRLALVEAREDITYYGEFSDFVLAHFLGAKPRWQTEGHDRFFPQAQPAHDEGYDSDSAESPRGFFDQEDSEDEFIFVRKRKESPEEKALRLKAEDWFRREYQKSERMDSGSTKGEKMKRTLNRMVALLRSQTSNHVLDKSELTEVGFAMRDAALDVCARQIAYMAMIFHNRQYHIIAKEIELECLNLIPIGFLGALPFETVTEKPSFFLRLIQNLTMLLGSSLFTFADLDMKSYFKNLRKAVKKLELIVDPDTFERFITDLNKVHDKFLKPAGANC